MPQDKPKRKPLKSDEILGRTPSQVNTVRLTKVSPEQERKLQSFDREQKLKNDPVETLRERSRELANLKAWGASAQFESGANSNEAETHSYDFRKQRGRRAPVMMKGSK